MTRDDPDILLDAPGFGSESSAATDIEEDPVIGPFRQVMILKRYLRLITDLAVSLSAIGACVALYRFGVMTVLASTFPLSQLQLTSLRRVGVTASLLGAYWAVARFYERRTVSELALAPVAMSLSASSGIILVGITILSLYALDAYQVLSFRGFAAAPSIMGVILVGVIFEEVVFRGVIFRLLEQHAGTAVALVAQALIFGGLHLFNTGTSPTTSISVTLLGAFWAVIYVYSRNLWAAIANHLAWNITIFLSGLPLSGQEEWRLSAPFASSYRGPAWLTGGAFGPEDSIVTLLVMASALGLLTHRAWRQGCFRSADRTGRPPIGASV